MRNSISATGLDLGKIKELPIEQQKEVDAQRILAIAYYHSNNEQMAEDIWKKLEK